VRGLAEAILSGDFLIKELPALSDHHVREAMKRIIGVGDWTADIYLTFCLLRPDILPKGDIALYEAIKTLKQLDKRPDYAQFESLTDYWRPWRSVGTRLLWHFYLCERGRS
jgi:DNA-3-methyladenine glycosylase II